MRGNDDRHKQRTTKREHVHLKGEEDNEKDDDSNPGWIRSSQPTVQDGNDAESIREVEAQSLEYCQC